MKIPMKFQDNSPDVAELQTLLNRAGESVAVDGAFGNQTRNAVEHFQSTHMDVLGHPLPVDGIAGNLTIGALMKVTASTPAVGVPVASFAGFDLAVYPGDSQMKTWRDSSSYEWVGYYLKSPFHPNASFMGKRATLVAMGWGLAVLYVGRQATSNPENLTRERGVAEGQDAAQKARNEGFAANTVIYLDVEPMDVVPQGIHDYLKGWLSAVLTTEFLPGIYCHIKNAQELRATAKDEYTGEANPRPMPAFWVSGSGHFDATKSAPSDSGISFAAIWQGVFNHIEEHGAVSLQIDVNVATSANPSGASLAMAAGNGSST